MRLLWLIVAAPLLAACTAAPPSTSPSATVTGPATAATPDPTEATIASLLARTPRLPAVPAGGACPVSGVTTRSPVAQPADATGLGTGPLYPITFYTGDDATLRLGARGAPSPGPDGLYEVKVVWANTTGYEGPVVVRVVRLDGPGRGAVRLSYDASASRGDAVVFTLNGKPGDYPSGTWVSGPGCYAYQIEGVNLSEVVVFRVVS